MEIKIEDEKYIYLYSRVKQDLIKKGYSNEIEWVSKLPNIKNIDKITFFREYVWVVINSGMKNQVAERIFQNFWIDNTHFNFESVRHPHKNKSIKQVYNRLDFYFNQFLQSKNKLKFLESLPHIAKITKYHLARNLGLEVAKPDRHLVRIAEYFNYNDVQKFCKKISILVHEKIGVVDLIFWRFANLTENYLEVINNWMNRG